MGRERQSQDVVLRPVKQPEDPEPRFETGVVFNAVFLVADRGGRRGDGGVGGQFIPQGTLHHRCRVMIDNAHNGAVLLAMARTGD